MLGIETKEAGNVNFSSRNKHLLLDLQADPKHFDIITIAPTNIADLANEVLFEIEHGLGYTPKADAYFYVLTTAGTDQGAYYRNEYFYPGGAGQSDTLTAETDNTYFRIRHRFESAFGGTSSSNTKTFQVKYYIYQVEGGVSLVLD